MLTSSTDTIEKHIRLRNREHEDVENMVRRFRLIDGEFRRLAPLYPNTIVIDRDSKEFHERAGLVEHHPAWPACRCSRRSRTSASEPVRQSIERVSRRVRGDGHLDLH